MQNLTERLIDLLEWVNGGQADKALPELEQLLRQQPDQPAILTVHAEALRMSGRLAESVDAYRHAGERGAGVRNWLIAGMLLGDERKVEEALQCLQRALLESPNSEEVLDALITTLFNNNRSSAGIEYARQQLRVAANPTYRKRAALLLQNNNLSEEASIALRQTLDATPNRPDLLGAALVPARFLCDWDWIESLQASMTDLYRQGKFGEPEEYPLTHITWCDDEALNLGVTRAHVARMCPRVPHLPARTTPRKPGRIRLGYVSNDFRNHATMHLMAGVFEAHDRGRFEVFAYDHSIDDVSQYRLRFLNAVEHHVPIASLSDKAAAERIWEDELDILFDLKLYTGGGRDGIFAYHPAPLQVAYLGYPGSAASDHIDFVVSDRFVTPDSSTPNYTEKFCRLPHSYQCNDRKRLAVPTPTSRAMHGLPDDKVVFGAFNQSYKIDRGSFTVWMRILEEVPNSVLWLLGQNDSAKRNLARYAEDAGIDPHRLIFAPFANPPEHLARLQLADAVLDALICNGHTTTSDALWAGVPVITARGRHFPSRVSESLLNAMELPELVGSDTDDMVAIAKRIGTDPTYRAALREKAAANRLTAPLFDTLRFTRNFENAIEAMIQAQRDGKNEHLDIPDCGDIEPSSTAQVIIDDVPLQVEYPSCPLCGGGSVAIGAANCTAHPSWQHGLPPVLEWMQCPSCQHVHTRYYLTGAGQAKLAGSSTISGDNEYFTALPAKRGAWVPTVRKAVELLGGYRSTFEGEHAPLWVDIGCGDGSLVMAASDLGFTSIGIDVRADAVSQIQRLGFGAMHADFSTLKIEVAPDVLSLMNVLECVPYPKEAVQKAARVLQPGALLIAGVPDRTSSIWRTMDALKTNPFWIDIENQHSFNRDRLISLLKACAFEIADVATPDHPKRHIEIYAIRK